MRLARILALGALLLVACTPRTGAGSVPPSAAAIEVTVAETSAGEALAGPDGMTLYVFANDTDGSSTCNEGCASAWPALLGDGSAVVAGAGVSGAFGTTTRDDGSRQITHGGQPLYYYASDQNPGDATGDGFGGVWSIAPVGASTASPGGSSEETAEPSKTPYQVPGY